MNRNMKLFFFLLFVFCRPAYAGCVDTDCPKKQDGTWKIQHFGDCPDEGCTRTKHHKFDPELNKLKNIRSDDQQPVLRSIRWMKGLPDPTNLTECGNRDELKQLGEGQKITVVAWALTARKGSQESANCDIKDTKNNKKDTDNHIVLVDPGVKTPTLAEDECRSVTAEFTPRVRQDHPKFTQDTLNHLIDKNWKPSQNNANGKLLVRVTGLLLFDSKHFFEAGLSRDINWEVHPVLKMEYCPKGKTCRADSDEDWKNLEE
jgi:hypothetical protein